MSIEDIATYLRVHEVYAEVSEEGNQVVVDIKWGDWKHDHLYCDHLMLGLGYKSAGEEITKQDGSDCYSATHYYEPNI